MQALITPGKTRPVRGCVLVLQASTVSIRAGPRAKVFQLFGQSLSFH